MYCRGCYYDLRSLPRGKCPECGKWFDPEDPRTFIGCRPFVPRGVSIAITYGSVLMLNLAFWLAVAPRAVPGSPSVTWRDRLNIGAWQMSGPAAWFFLPETSETLKLAWGAFLCSWTMWLIIVLFARLKQLSCGWHLLLALLWSLAGCIRAGLMIT